MTTYFIGDVQGCYAELQQLLARIAYRENQDQLVFLGDIVNRGPHSLDTLRLIRSFESAVVTLGNHDLYCLAIGFGAIKKHKPDTLHALLQDAHLDEHLEWLRQQPLLISNDRLKIIAVHAGIPPQWDLKAAKTHAEELEACLRGPRYFEFLSHMMGDRPNSWSPNLTGWDRLRYLINAFTRMRFCNQAGTLELQHKSSRHIDLPDFKPWFAWPHDYEGYQICFGHWAALMGVCSAPDAIALDTGCVWGNQLTALAVEDTGEHRLIQVPSA